MSARNITPEVILNTLGVFPITPEVLDNVIDYFLDIPRVFTLISSFSSNYLELSYFLSIFAASKYHGYGYDDTGDDSTDSRLLPDTTCLEGLAFWLFFARRRARRQ